MKIVVIMWNRKEPHGTQQICESLCIANLMVGATEMLSVKPKDSSCVRTLTHPETRWVCCKTSIIRRLKRQHPEACVSLSMTSKINLDLTLPWLLQQAGRVPITRLPAGKFTPNQLSKQIKVYCGESCTWQYPTTLLWCPYASRTLYKGFCRHGSAVFRNCTLSGNVLCKSVDKVQV